MPPRASANTNAKGRKPAPAKAASKPTPVRRKKAAVTKETIDTSDDEVQEIPPPVATQAVSDADVDDDVQASEVVNDEPAPEPSRRSSRSTQGQRSKSRFGHDDAISDLSELDEKPTPRRRQPKAKQRVTHDQDEAEDMEDGEKEVDPPKPSRIVKKGAARTITDDNEEEGVGDGEADDDAPPPTQKASKRGATQARVSKGARKATVAPATPPRQQKVASAQNERDAALRAQDEEEWNKAYANSDTEYPTFADDVDDTAEVQDDATQWSQAKYRAPTPDCPNPPRGHNKETPVTPTKTSLKRTHMASNLSPLAEVETPTKRIRQGLQNVKVDDENPMYKPDVPQPGNIDRKGKGAALVPAGVAQKSARTPKTRPAYDVTSPENLADLFKGYRTDEWLDPTYLSPELPALRRVYLDRTPHGTDIITHRLPDIIRTMRDSEWDIGESHSPEEYEPDDLERRVFLSIIALVTEPNHGSGTIYNAARADPSAFFKRKGTGRGEEDFVAVKETASENFAFRGTFVTFGLVVKSYLSTYETNAQGNPIKGWKVAVQPLTAEFERVVALAGAVLETDRFALRTFDGEVEFVTTRLNENNNAFATKSANTSTPKKSRFRKLEENSPTKGASSANLQTPTLSSMRAYPSAPAHKRVPVFDARGFFDGISDPEAFHLDLFENQCPRWKGEEIPPYAFCAVIHSISRWKDNGLWRLSFGLYAVVVLFADEEDEDADGAE